MSGIGTLEIIIIAVIIMVLFGSKRLPEFIRSLGTASKEFKKALKDDEEAPKKRKKSS